MQSLHREYQACLNTASSTLRMRQCADRLHKGADQALNHYFQKLMATLSKDNQQRLRQAQQSWIKFRHADCQYRAGLYSGGTLASQVINDCVAESTLQRAKTLASYYEEARHH